MAKEGGQKMHAAVEAAMKKFNIKPPGPPPGGMGAPGGGNPMMQQSQGSGAKRSSSPYKQRRFWAANWNLVLGYKFHWGQMKGSEKGPQGAANDMITR